LSSEYWFKRVENIKNTVSLRNLIDKYSIQCQTDGVITQVHCPFHGFDAHASARLYDTNTMYCWVCSRKWDVISFIKDYHKLAKFSEACRFLENMYGLEKPDVAIVYQEPSFEDHLKELDAAEDPNFNFEKEFKKIDNLLLRSKPQLNLDQYSRYYCYLDNLFSSYKLNRYTGNLSLKLALTTLNQEILKIT
jgi:hypothetical protein